MRPAWRLWLIVYTGCGLVALAGLGVGVYSILGLERARNEALDADRRRDRIDIATRSMDVVVRSLYDREAYRDPRHFESFHGVDNAVMSIMLSPRDASPHIASPLLLAALGRPARPGDADDFVRLHFQTDVVGRVTAPTAPEGVELDRLRRLATQLEGETGRPADALLGQLEGQYTLLEAVSEIIGGRGIAFADDALEVQINEGLATTPELSDAPPADGAGAAPPDWAELDAIAQQDPGFAAVLAEIRRLGPALRLAGGDSSRDTDQTLRRVAMMLAEANPAQRARVLDGLRDQTAVRMAAERMRAQGPDGVLLIDEANPYEIVGRPRFVWRIGTANEMHLFLVRDVETPNGRVLQGVWFDWERLERELTAIAQNELPGAHLEPVRGSLERATSWADRLISMPLIVQSPPLEFDNEGPLSSPTRWALVTMVATVLGSYLAVGLALHASAQLATRRGRFVSAVTHELRTPLTTFRLYTELLADGLVKDETKRAAYLTTLKDESARLGTIVENVLSYARLRPGRRKGDRAAVEVAPFVERVSAALGRRAAHGSMTLELDAEGVGEAVFEGEADTVERVLGNLVDNSVKYASDAADARVHLAVRAGGGRVRFWVGDHGPGIPAKDRSRIFDAFRRGRRQADTAKSGLGLGLALARGLSRDMGGDLRLAAPGKGPLRFCQGAVFVLELRQRD
ncbi:MAG: HAMP domain-containing sensor histidine kinase [Planctomycetota bacterium]